MRAAGEMGGERREGEEGLWQLGAPYYKEIHFIQLLLKSHSM